MSVIGILKGKQIKNLLKFFREATVDICNDGYISEPQRSLTVFFAKGRKNGVDGDERGEKVTPKENNTKRS